MLCMFMLYAHLLSGHAKQIFIPINDTLDDHWFLFVINMGDEECEILDCKPAPEADERRKDYASAAVIFNFILCLH